MTSSRNKNQDLALKIIYNFLLLKKAHQDLVFEETLEDLSEQDNFDHVDPFVKLVTLKGIKYYDEIVEKFTPFLNNWTWERLPLMSQAILILAYSHFVYVQDVEKAVVINVGVNQAKNYLDANEHRFINAVLDKVL